MFDRLARFPWTSSFRIAACAALALLPPVVDRAAAADASAAVDDAPPARFEESPEARDARMKWWRDARFGMFIHWGLYAIPAGAWGDRTDFGEWIRHSAQIPHGEYARFAERFDPVEFDADAWMALAARAGMRYVVITSKHHDGFALFDSAETEFDVMETPFRRDIMAEIADAARRRGLVPCWYHSIMDWNHPDYLPRRGWEAAERTADGADFDRYVRFLHAQVRELLTKYGPIGVMWFDGEWEETWTHEHGVALDALCRSLQPSIIVNNRVDKGRNDMAGLNRAGDWAGDFGTPEQEVPATGIPGVDWESCMTMNRHWGFNARDTDYKSTTELVRTLVDVVSKGGNFLLNVGPRADGTIPPESVERLEAMGRWMLVNGDSIEGGGASRVGAVPWGRTTGKRHDDGRYDLFLHVFERPGDGDLFVPGLFSAPRRVELLGAPEHEIVWQRVPGGMFVRIPAALPNDHAAVVRLSYPSEPAVYAAPRFIPEQRAFVDSLTVFISPPVGTKVGEPDERRPAGIKYTVDGRDPTVDDDWLRGAVPLRETTEIRARVFRDGRPVSAVSRAVFTKVQPWPASDAPRGPAGLRRTVYRGEFTALPDWSAMEPIADDEVSEFDLPEDAGERVLVVFEGFVEIDRTGVHEFALTSDDGSRLWIGDRLVVDNDGLHGPLERRGSAPLARGLHPIRVAVFNRTGSMMLEVTMADLDADRRSGRAGHQRINWSRFALPK